MVTGRWDAWMEVALAEAERVRGHGDVPVGAVVVSATGDQVAVGGNERELTGDPTAHAEVVALRRAAARVGEWRLPDHTLVVTLEPCAMCAGAVVASRIGRVVMGALDPKAGAVCSLFDLLRDPRLVHRPEVVTGVLAERSGVLLREFFSPHRADGPPPQPGAGPGDDWRGGAGRL